MRETEARARDARKRDVRVVRVGMMVVRGDVILSRVTGAIVPSFVWLKPGSGKPVRNGLRSQGQMDAGRDCSRTTAEAVAYKRASPLKRAERGCGRSEDDLRPRRSPMRAAFGADRIFAGRAQRRKGIGAARAA